MPAAAGIPPKEAKSDDSMLQIIDETQAFTAELGLYMKTRWDLFDKGFDYNLVAVFGSQSTGKSTLLNRLFGTRFDVMNEQARRQTTKGIWMSKAPDGNLLVLDVEGTDGRERGEDQDFERKSALFSLATTEVLIVNMWETMIGLYAGANLGLLRTVFEVNVQLFQQKGTSKTLLYFVIRDFTGQTSLKSLSDTLLTDLGKIWADLAKPDDLKNSSVSDLFDFKFFGLPHKIFAAPQFEQEVAKLRGQFNDPANESFVFQRHYKKNIPADGFPHFAESIWEKILSNRDLDLPTQQQLLAQYRCDEISRVVLETFTQTIYKFKHPLEAGKVVEGFGVACQCARDEAVAAFDKDASRYNNEVYTLKKTEFFNRCNEPLNVFFVGQLRNLHRTAISTCKEDMRSPKLSVGDNFMYELTETVSKAKQYFLIGAKDALLKDTDWSYTELLAQLENELDLLASLRRSEEVKTTLELFEKHVSMTLAEPLSAIFADAKPDIWEKTLVMYQGIVERTMTQLNIKCDSFQTTAEERGDLVRKVKDVCWSALKAKVTEECQDSSLLLKLRTRFEARFRYDERDVPRVWTPADDIDSYFTTARDEAEKLLTLLARIDIPIKDLEPFVPIEVVEDPSLSLVVLLPSKVASTLDRLKREMDVLFVEAKRSVVSTTAKIPSWLFVLLLLLGWNELMSVLSSPVYFMSLLVFGGAIYVVYGLGLAGPMLQVTVAASKEVGKQLHDKLEAHGMDVNSAVRTVGGTVNFAAGMLGYDDMVKVAQANNTTAIAVDTTTKNRSASGGSSGRKRGGESKSPKEKKAKDQ